MAVTHQKLFDAKLTGGMRRSEEHDVTHAGRHQLNPAQDECSHQDFAELGIGLQQRQHLRTIELDHLAGLGDAQAQDGGATRKGVDFARELPRPENGDKGFGPGPKADDLERPGDNDEERNDGFSGFVDHGAGLNRALPSMWENAANLIRRQRRKYLISESVDYRKSTHAAMASFTPGLL